MDWTGYHGYYPDPPMVVNLDVPGNQREDEDENTLWDIITNRFLIPQQLRLIKRTPVFTFRQTAHARNINTHNYRPELVTVNAHRRLFGGKSKLM